MKDIKKNKGQLILRQFLVVKMLLAFVSFLALTASTAQAQNNRYGQTTKFSDSNGTRGANDVAYDAAADKTLAEAAKQSSSTASKGQAINQMLGAAQIAAGTAIIRSCAASKCSCCPAGFVLLGMGALSFAQAGALGGSAGDYTSICKQSSTGNLCDPKLNGLSEKGSFSGDGAEGADGWNSVSDHLAELEKHGIKVDKNSNTITLPDGKTIDATNLTSSARDAGISEGDMQAAMKKNEELNKDVMEKFGLTAGQEQLVMNRQPSNEEGDDSDFDLDDQLSDAQLDKALNDLLNEKNKNKNKVSGLFKYFNGDPIGVTSDDIFQMVTRRYQTKEKENSFITVFEDPKAKTGSAKPLPKN